MVSDSGRKEVTGLPDTEISCWCMEVNVTTRDRIILKPGGINFSWMLSENVFHFRARKNALLLPRTKIAQFYSFSYLTIANAPPPFLACWLGPVCVASSRCSGSNAQWSISHCFWTFLLANLWASDLGVRLIKAKLFVAHMHILKLDPFLGLSLSGIYATFCPDNC